MKVSKTREELVKMYIDSLKEGDIPWRQRWTTSLNINGVSNIEYKGINQLLLSLVTYNNKYNNYISNCIYCCVCCCSCCRI